MRCWKVLSNIKFGHAFDFTTSEEAETSQGEMEDSQHNRKSVCSPASKLNILRMIKSEQWT